MELAAQIERVFREVLELSDCPHDADFRALGGDSIAAVQIVARLRAELNMELPVNALFQYATVGALAKAIKEGAF